MVYPTFPSTRLSSTPVTVTSWAEFQLALVNTRLGGDTVPSVVSLLLSPMVTSAVGWLFSTTVKVAVPPASVVLPEIADTVMPAGIPKGVTFTYTPLGYGDSLGSFELISKRTCDVPAGALS